MKKSKLLLKALSLVLIFLCVFPLLVSCKGRALGQTSLAKKEVGKVGNYSVSYEEFYFVANNNYNLLKAQYKNDTEGLKTAVWENTVKNLASNFYAILTLCEAEGIKYDPKELQDEIDDLVEEQINTNFNGSRNDYLKSQQEAGLTDHYVRFTFGMEIMYERLLAKYQESELKFNSDEEIKNYIKDNFIHTWHIAVIVDQNEDRNAELEKAKGYLERLNNGESFFKLTSYSEDVQSEYLTDVYGMYFHKGEMAKEYEDVAWALKVNQRTSDIVVSTAQPDEYGPLLDCFYIIERLPVTDEEINKNFDILASRIQSATIAQKLEETKASLSFEPNEYAKTLDVTNLKQPKNGIDYHVTHIIVACLLVCTIIITSVILIRKAKLKKFNRLKQTNLVKK